MRVAHTSTRVPSFFVLNNIYGFRFVATRLGCGVVKAVHRQKRQRQVGYLDQHSVQGRFINQGTAQYGVAVGIVGDGESLEPGGPMLVEMSLDTNFIPVHRSSL